MSPIVNEHDQLIEIVNKAESKGFIAIDTEFTWEKTYYPILGIVQLAFSRDDFYLVDVVLLKELEPLSKLLMNSKVVKIFHDATQDLSVLRHHTGSSTKNVFDTRCAAGFANMGSSLSLRDLIHAILDFEISKNETRSDWLRRPLTKLQIQYAIDDVRYLPELRINLLERIEKKNNIDLFKEECEQIETSRSNSDKDPFSQYRQIRGGVGRLSRLELSVLRELAAWRESMAQTKDRPKRWIMTDEKLIYLATSQPKSLAELKSWDFISEWNLQKYGSGIIEAVKAGLAMSPDKFPALLKSAINHTTIKAHVDSAMGFIQGKCSRLGIDPTLLVSRNELKALITEGTNASPENHRILRGWRKEFLNKELKSLLLR